MEEQSPNIIVRKVPIGLRHCKYCGEECVSFWMCRSCCMLEDAWSRSINYMNEKWGNTWKEVANKKLIERRGLAASNFDLKPTKKDIERERNLPPIAIASGDQFSSDTGPRMGKWVYFIQEPVNHHIKIGVSENVKSRLKALQTSSPFPLKILCSVRETTLGMSETQVHKKFENLRVQGEWFKYGEELKNFIDMFKFNEAPK